MNENKMGNQIKKVDRDYTINYVGKFFNVTSV